MRQAIAFPSKRLLANASALTFGASAVALRFFVPDRLLRGLSRARWAAGLGATAAGIKFIETFILVTRRQVPAGRILLPGLVFLELTRIRLGQTSRASLFVVLVVFELGLITFAIGQLCAVHGAYRFIEDHLEQVFRQFVPDRVAALASRELVLLFEGLCWLGRGFRNAPAPGFSYVQESIARYLPMIIPLVSVGDEVTLGILLRNQAVWIRLAVITVDVWAILFAFGLFATFHSRPHEVASDSVQLRCGVFGTCEFSPALLLEAAHVSDAERRTYANVGRLTVKGSPMVKISLRQPVLVCHGFRRPRAFDTLLVSADEPERFCRALRQAATLAGCRSEGSNPS